MLRHSLQNDERLVRPMITALAGAFSFTAEEGFQLLYDYIENDTSFHVKNISQMLPRLIDKENTSRLESKLNSVEVRQAERIIGEYY